MDGCNSDKCNKSNLIMFLTTENINIESTEQIKGVSRDKDEDEDENIKNRNCRIKFTYKYLEDEWTRGYWKFICDNQNKVSWCSWYSLSKNPNITWEIIRENLDKPWNWWELSRHPSITWDIIQKNSDKPWCFKHLSSNPNITWDLIEIFLELGLVGSMDDWNYISDNPNIT